MKSLRQRRTVRFTHAERLGNLPPYSPDFNPIEKLFAKLKALLPKSRRADRRRPLDGHRRMSRQILRANAPDYFEAAGYEPT